MDKTHASMSEQLCVQVNKVDRFFGNSAQNKTAKGFLKLRTGIQWQHLNENSIEFQPSIKMRVRLPNISRKVNLLITDDETDKNTIPSAKSTATLGDGEESSILGKLLGVARSEPVDYDFDVGSKSDDGPRLFTRARATFQFWPKDNSNLRLSQSLFWLDGLGYGQESRLEYNQTLSEFTLFRWNTIAEFSEETSGLSLEQNLVFYKQVDDKRGLSYNLRVVGDTRPTLKVNEYGFLVLYRQNFFRPWLYFEVEPSVFWPLETERDMALRFVVRLEMQFGNEI